MLEKTAASLIFKHLDKLDTGSLTVMTPDGKTRMFEGRNKGDHATIQIKDWKVLSGLIHKGDVGFAQDYRDGLWETDQLVNLISLSLINKDALEGFLFGNRFFRIIAGFSYFLRLNTLKGSKKNIYQHYDLGNDFYRLWLDPSMTYSSALFNRDTESLEQAQYNKYDRILDRLEANSGNILEIGCGWGGFAERAMGRGDFLIKGITLSQEQYDYAHKQLNGTVQIKLEDYRHQKGKFDHIVSIEMFEAVGEKYWQTYFNQIYSLLKPKGKALIQTITIGDSYFSRYRKSGDFIRSYIFPGGMLPSPSRFKEDVKKSGLKTGSEFYFGNDYARTLSQWLLNFDQNRNQVQALGFDDGFIRMWRFYLAACIAGFKTGRTDVMQIELMHA